MFWLTCCNVIPITNIHMYITNGKVFGGGGGGTPNILIFVLFLDNLSISEQSIERALTIHTDLYKYDSMKKNNSFDFHHIPKLSIGFNAHLSLLNSHLTQTHASARPSYRAQMRAIRRGRQKMNWIDNNKTGPTWAWHKSSWLLPYL